MIKLDAKNADLGLSGGCPRVLSFPIGVPPNAEELDLQLSHKTSGRGKRKRQVTSSLDGLTYRGCDHGEYSSANNSVQFAIARLDESTGILSIVPADHAFIMRPELEKSSLSVPPRLSSLSTAERREMRTDEFGSRKKQRAQQVAASNVISAQNISGASAVETSMMENVNVDGPKLEDATEKAIAENREIYLPKFDATTDDVAHIYPLSSLISVDADAALEEYSEQIFTSLAEVREAKTDGVKKDKKPSASQLAESFSKYMQTKEGASECVLRGLSKIKDHAASAAEDVADAGEKEKQIRKKFKKLTRRVIMLHFLVRFHQTMSASVSSFKPDAYKSDIADKVKAPQAVSNFLFSNFTSASRLKGKVTFTKLEGDKLKIYMIALFLHIGKFSCSVSVIAKDLKLVDKVMSELARQMGCKVTKDQESKETVVTLTAPLNFPGMKRPLSSKKK